jgi:hypothetical protein
VKQVWSARFVGFLKPAPRHEFWRASYRDDRYMRGLTQLELNRRFRDLVRNLVIITSDGKIGLPPLSPGGADWAQLITHTLEEFRLTYGPYPAGFTGEVHREEKFPDFAGALAQKATSVLAARGLKSRDVFLRFGKPEHMTSLFEEGRLRVQPASEYSKPDHNGAVRDDELSLEVSLYVTRDTIRQVVKNPQDVAEDLEWRRLDFRFSRPSDFWLYCVSSSVESRLFVDFEASACVIIRDREEFRQRLLRAGAAAFPGARARDGNAVYIDPLQPRSARIDVPMSKHFKYAYQLEHRFIWEAPNTAPLVPLDLELGSLKDIAELVLL